MSEQYVWVVTYWDEGCEPVVTVFNNQKAAQQCHYCFSLEHNCCIDKAQIFSAVSFVPEENEDEKKEEEEKK